MRTLDFSIGDGLWAVRVGRGWIGRGGDRQGATNCQPHLPTTTLPVSVKRVRAGPHTGFAGAGAASSANPKQPLRSPHQAFGMATTPGFPTIARNSRRVDGSVRNVPSMREVTIVTPALCTPRVDMH
ncbi:hypothetical protein OKW50_005396 [Paraburkholderia youngii]